MTCTVLRDRGGEKIAMEQMTLAEIDAALLKGMDDAFDGPTRPCGAPARPPTEETPADVVDPMDDAALLAAMDGAMQRPADTNLVAPSWPDKGDSASNGTSMGYLTLPSGVAEAIDMETQGCFSRVQKTSGCPSPDSGLPVRTPEEPQQQPTKHRESAQ